MNRRQQGILYRHMLCFLDKSPFDGNVFGVLTTKGIKCYTETFEMLREIVAEGQARQQIASQCFVNIFILEKIKSCQMASQPQLDYIFPS